MFIELVLIHAHTRARTHTHSSLELNSSVGTGFSKRRYEHVSICAHISEQQIMIKCVSPSMCLSRSEEQLEREGNKFDDTCSSHPHPPRRHHHHVHIDDNWLSKWSHQTNRTYVLSLVTARVHVINYLSRRTCCRNLRLTRQRRCRGLRRLLLRRPRRRQSILGEDQLVNWSVGWSWCSREKNYYWRDDDERMALLWYLYLNWNLLGEDE